MNGAPGVQPVRQPVPTAPQMPVPQPTNAAGAPPNVPPVTQINLPGSPTAPVAPPQLDPQQAQQLRAMQQAENQANARQAEQNALQQSAGMGVNAGELGNPWNQTFKGN